MNAELTIKIESRDYVAAERALRLTTEQQKQAMFGEPLGQAILIARQALGFSMWPQDKLTDYVEPPMSSCWIKSEETL